MTNTRPSEGRRRSAEKRLTICAFLAIFTFSTEAILLQVIGIKGRGICAQLHRLGLVRPVKVPLSSTTKVWTLTPEGLRVAELALGRSVSYPTHPTRLTLSTMTHDLMVQREALARLPTDLPALRRLRSDRELRNWQGSIRPDLLISHVSPDGHRVRVCFELELTSKPRAEIAQKMRSMLGVLDSRTLWVWYFAPQAGEHARRRYEDTWAEVVAEHGTGLALSQQQLAQACRFELAMAK